MNIKIILVALFGLSAFAVQAQDDNRKTHNIGVGINHHGADSTLYSSGNLALFGDVDTLRGVQAGTFTATVRKQLRGVNIAGIILSLIHI